MDTFKEQLNYALRCEPVADLFYKKQFDVTTKRYDWADEYGREMQRRDIDCTIYKDGGSPINLSEKFRDDDWEIWLSKSIHNILIFKDGL